MLLYCQFGSYFTFITKEKLMLEHMLMLVFLWSRQGKRLTWQKSSATWKPDFKLFF